MNKPLSSIEIYNALDGKVRVLMRGDILDYNTVEELLEPHGAIVLLYKHEKDAVGHWTALFRAKNNSYIEHFDSYGYYPDEELDIMGIKQRKYLCKLLSESDMPIRYSHKKLQKKGATCGRWVIMRLILKNLNENEFYKEIGGINLDAKITRITNNLFNI